MSDHLDQAADAVTRAYEQGREDGRQGLLEELRRWRKEGQRRIERQESTPERLLEWCDDALREGWR